MPATKKKPKNIKWMTIQISPEQNKDLEKFCGERRISKAAAIRTILENLYAFEIFLGQLQKDALVKLKSEQE
jgi:hypothetical protein